jgi:hypothetical protein
MKTRTKLMFFVIVSFILITSCEKLKNNGPDEGSYTNFFEYDSSKYVITQAFIENYGKTGAEEIYNLDLYFLSNELEIIDSNKLFTSIDGIGNGMYFELFTSYPNKIDTGIYNCHNNTIGEINTFDQGNVYIGYDFTTSTGTDLEIKEGYISVEQNDPTYEIQIKCTLKNGGQLVGYYKGPIGYFDSFF